MEAEKTLTTTEIMGISGLTRATVLKRAKALGFTRYSKYVLKRTLWGNYIKEFTFTESQVKAMGCDHDVSRKAKECNAQENEPDKIENQDTLAALKREHPLVTNINCFKQNWWPETVPSVLLEDEE